MDNITDALKEVRRSLVLTRLFNRFTNTVLIFLVFALILTIFKLSWKFALIPPIIYLLPGIYNAFIKTSYKDVEDIVPDLEWQLRTAADNAEKQDEIVKSLKNLVLKNVKNIRSSFFLDEKSLVYKLVAIGCLSFIIVLIGSFHVNFGDFKGIFPTGFVNKLGKGAGGIFGENFAGVFDRKNDRDIYGEESVVELGNEEINLQITPENSLFDPSNLNNIENYDFTQSGVLNDIGASPDQSYEDRIKKEEQELIKTYLNKLAEYSNKKKQ